MINSIIKQKIISDDINFKEIEKSRFSIPKYNAKTYTEDILKSNYYYAIILIRHYLRMVADYHLSFNEGSKNIDLFMLTPSISSPCGPGSDSVPIPIKFGKLNTNLVDSSQFGFEPLLLFKNLDKVHCYLPSMRGEDFDKRHLNQFFHLEMEIVGALKDLKPTIEKLLKVMASGLLLMENIIDKVSSNPQKTKVYLSNIIAAKKFQTITFDQAIEVLTEHNKKEFINFTPKGRDISARGELELMKILKVKTPLWISGFDRDRVPFYQKPDPENPNRTINADLLFPPIEEGAFGGEIIGSGQRQDSCEEMYDSLKRQNGISPQNYEWYINLRRNKNYTTTSGFGLGVERLITWALGNDNIQNAILYPRLKNIKTFP